MSARLRHQLEFTSDNAQGSEWLGHMLGQLLHPGDVICLSGDLGAGKTVYGRGIGAGFGLATPLTSPTFNLVHEHKRAADDARLFHIDCYRIEDGRDLDSIGMDDILDSAATVILEWPERVVTALPSARLWVDIYDGGESQRHFVLQACGDRYLSLLANYQRLIRNADGKENRRSSK